MAGRTGLSQVISSRNRLSPCVATDCASAARAGSFASSQGLRWSMYWLARSARAMISRTAEAYSRASYRAAIASPSATNDS